MVEVLLIGLWHIDTLHMARFHGCLPVYPNGFGRLQPALLVNIHCPTASRFLSASPQALCLVFASLRPLVSANGVLTNLMLMSLCVLLS